MKRKSTDFKVFLGTTKGSNKERIYLEGFSWDCKWYWGGGYITSKNMHCHFNGCFLDAPDTRGHPLGRFYDPWTKLPDYLEEKDVSRIRNGCSLWESITFFLDGCPDNIVKNWWRIKDLYKQFYIYTAAAEAFQHGGHCSSDGRTEEEINKGKAEEINNHIQSVIIPEIVKVLEV